MKLFDFFWIFAYLISVGVSSSSSDYLKVKGNHFYFGKSKVFLSGVNFAWNNYAYDFGNNQYSTSGKDLEAWIKDVARNGGNSLRVWIHCEGQNTPEFDKNGFPTATDRDGTMISDLTKFLNVAYKNNVLVVLVLWNGAVKIDGKYRNLLENDAKLESYLKNVITPMVRALKQNPALAAWEIMNEPEGSIMAISEDTDPCYDTEKMGPFGGGWTNSSIPIKWILKFINRISAAIKKEAPKSLVTLGSWSHISQTDAFPNSFNYYKDQCLIKAGGEKIGTIDFFQIHTYSWEGQFAKNSPFLENASSYKLNKPVIIGEFSSTCAAGRNVDDLWQYGYEKGYNGLMSWQYHPNGGHCSDSQIDQQKGMKKIRKFKKNGIISLKMTK